MSNEGYHEPIEELTDATRSPRQCKIIDNSSVFISGNPRGAIYSVCCSKKGT